MVCESSIRFSGRAVILVAFTIMIVDPCTPSPETAHLSVTRTLHLPGCRGAEYGWAL